MTEEYTIPLAKIIKELGLREMHLPCSAEEILICSRDVIRPGLELYGFCDYFDPHRITVLGRSEMAMLDSLGEEKKTAAIDRFFALRPATVIVARGIDPCGFMRAAADFQPAHRHGSRGDPALYRAAGHRRHRCAAAIRYAGHQGGVPAGSGGKL